MKLVLLIFRNLSRRKLRSALNMLTLFIAAFLLTVLIAVPVSLNRIIEDASTGLRVIVSAPNAYMLPIWYRDAIAKMPGVVAATAERQWGGIYKDERQPIVSFGIDPDVQEVFPESFLTADQVKEFLRERRSALVGRMLMEKYHWHVGQWVTLKNGDSKLALSFVIIAQLPGKITQNSFVFRREYFDQAVKQTFGVDITDSASFIAVRIAHVNEIPQVIEEIDGRFRNSEYETSTITESDSIANGVSAIADLSTIILSLCAVVVITVMLVAANSMAISVRERISEVAVIRALGFEPLHVAAMLFGEAAAMGLVGGAAGAGLAWALFGRGVTMGAVVGGLGYIQVTPDITLAALFAIVTVSLASAIVPVLQAININPALAFRKVV
jgi:putative ABC transport system permease protein